MSKLLGLAGVAGGAYAAHVIYGQSDWPPELQAFMMMALYALTAGGIGYTIGGWFELDNEE